jgi:dipeptidyl aminopeptidase/acylaminoacyl peptidase
MTMVDLKARFDAASEIPVPDLRAALDAKLTGEALRAHPRIVVRRSEPLARALTIAAALIVAAIAIGVAVHAFRSGKIPSNQPLPVIRIGGEYLEIRYRGGQATSETDKNLGLFAVDPVTGEARRLVSPAIATVRAAEWSPDGTSLVYEDARTGAFYVLDANGTHQVPVPGWGGHLWWVSGAMSWSHDASRLAVMSPVGASSNGPAGLYVVDPYAPAIAAVSRFVPGTETQEPSAPLWSWNDTRIAYGAQGFSHGGTPSGILHIVSPDGSDPVELHCLTYGCDPAWQPNGDLIAYLVEGGVAVSPSDGSSSTVIADSHGWFRWSPDGSLLAYASGVDRGLETFRGLWIVSPDGSAARPILRLDARSPIQGMAWSPDGTFVAIRVDTGGYGDRQSWRLVAVDGSDLRTPISQLPRIDQGAIRTWMEG